MMGILKLGGVVFVTFAFGGPIGIAVLNKVSDTKSTDTVTGAKWAGRVVTFLATSYVVSKVL